MFDPFDMKLILINMIDFVQSKIFI